jgi:hypothetical protein
MRKLFLSVILVGSFIVVSYAENNDSAKANSSIDSNNSIKVTQSTENNDSAKIDRTEKKIQEQMKREQKYAKEQKFYQGSDYNLSADEVDEKSLSSIPVIEPDYDFSIDDVYRDDQ